MGSISITGSTSLAPNWLPQYTYMSDLEAVVSNTLLLTQHPSFMCLSTYSLYFPGAHKAVKQTN